MSLPPPQSPQDLPASPAPPAGAPAAAGRTRQRWMLPTVLGVVGVGAGLLVGALVFSGDDGAGAPEGAAADAMAGCQSLFGLPEDGIPDFDELDDDDDSWAFEGTYLWRLQAASASFRAAANGDRDYRSLGDDADTMQRAYQQFQIEEANDAIADLRDWCTDHDLAP